MAYAIIRARKLTTSGQMGGMQRHNDRTNNVKNVDSDLTHSNRNYSKYGTKSILKDVEQRLEETNVNVRSNSVRCIEYLITASPEAFKNLKKNQKKDGTFVLMGSDAPKYSDFQSTALKFLKEKHGEDNLVNFSIHYDEKTPHIHAYVTPIVEKEVKWKNQKGEGVKVENRLSARDFLGGKDKLQQLQDDFAKAVEHLGLERGQKGSVAKHQTVQKFYGQLEEGKNNLESKQLQDSKVALNTPSKLDLLKIDKWVAKEQERLTKELKIVNKANYKIFTDVKSLGVGVIHAKEEEKKSKIIRSTQVEKAFFYKNLVLGLIDEHPKKQKFSIEKVKDYLIQKGVVTKKEEPKQEQKKEVKQVEVKEVKKPKKQILR